MSHQLIQRTWRGTLLASCVLASASFAPTANATALKAYNVDPAQVSTSGLSAGAFMSVQLGVAYSSVITKGFASFAGGPYDCARSQTYSSCMNNGTPSITASVANMKSWSGGNIDTTANLANRKIYMWVGSSDTTVGPNVENQTKAQLANFDNVNNVSYNTLSGAAHTFPTDFSGSGDNGCSMTMSPYISNCTFDGAGAALQWIHGTLNAKNTGTLTGSVISFDQTAYVASGNGFDTTGYMYVPAACSSGSTVCKLHVALHGCVQSYASVGADFVNNTGFNKWADTNNFIILYPQAIADSTSHSTWDSGSVANSNGCFDWIGWYGTNDDYHGGVQMVGLINMINKITSGYSSSPPAVPTGLNVTGTGSTTVSLGWNTDTGATSYNIYRGGTKVGSSTTLAYTDTGLTASTQYSYTITGVNGAGESSQTSAVLATTQAQGAVPAQVTGLAAGTTTTTTVPLSWSTDSGATSYNLYRNGTKVVTGIATTSYTDTGLTLNTTYTYNVSASNSNGEGPESTSVQATTQSYTPTCYNTNNYAHVTAGRAHDSGGYALANGSNANMGLDNTFYTTQLEETSDNYYIIKTGACP